MEIKGKVTRRRLERLKAEGLITKSQELEMEANLFMESKRVQAVKLRTKAKKVVAELASLTDAEVRDRLRYTEEDIRALNETIHTPGRHAMAVQSGLKLKAMVNGLLEKQTGDGGGISVTVNTLGANGPRTVTVATSQPEKSSAILAEGEEGEAFPRKE